MAKDCCPQTYFIYFNGTYVNVAKILSIGLAAGKSNGVTLTFDNGTAVGATLTDDDTQIKVISTTQGSFKRTIMPQDVIKQISNITGQPYVPPQFPTSLQY